MNYQFLQASSDDYFGALLVIGILILAMIAIWAFSKHRSNIVSSQPPSYRPLPEQQSTYAEQSVYAVGSNCNVCMVALSEFDAIVQCPFCRNYFHYDCLRSWIRLRGTCPVCTKRLKM